MTDLINGRTPEEIKRVLAWRIFRCGDLDCGDLDCGDCPYGDICSHENEERSEPDALALIEHLEAKIPKWISVKDRLPKNEETVLIAGCREGISGKLWPVVMTAFHIDGKMFAQDSCYAWSDDNIEMEYDEDADDFVIPEGWFEDVQCADEFSMVYDIRVTHWMPLPEPPREGET